MLQNADATNILKSWFYQQGWKPAAFQEAAWSAFLSGQDGLIQVPTGSGKTYAAFGGPLISLAADEVKAGTGLQILYITPLRALARDTELSLRAAAIGCGLSIDIESRTGDTSEKIKARQRARLPEVLIITPESLALLLARPNARVLLSQLRCAIVDEWHELLASKRGVQVELNLSRCRSYSPKMRTWGMSATIENIHHAAEVLFPPKTKYSLIQSDIKRPVLLETILPDLIDPFPWAGHMGLSMLPKIIGAINPEESTLIFTNTRRQAEAWFQAIRDERPDWQTFCALHHGSLSLQNREAIESGLKNGEIKIVIATSALDLGVDFPYVDRVFQIGSPKAVSRLMQRAGRSAHRPGATCRAYCIPTNSFEILEFVAARMALRAGALEARKARAGDLDVLIQHMITIAIGGGFTACDLLNEVRATYSYRHLSAEDFAWCLSFIVNGGNVLNAYPSYKKVNAEGDFYSMTDRRQCSIHRLNIGTISSDEQVQIKMLRGGRLGYVDESYIERLKKGDRFIFAGRTLEFIKLYELTATVKSGGTKTAEIPAFQGQILPLSLTLGQEVRKLLGQAKHGQFPTSTPDEVHALTTIISKQIQVSTLPKEDQYLFETWVDSKDSYFFCYSFAGKSLNEGLASILSLRFSRLEKATFAIAANDYGCLIVRVGGAFDFKKYLDQQILSTDRLEQDIAASIDAGQTAKRKFRNIARIAGLVPQKYPGNHHKGGRAIHVSSTLLYSTLERFDPKNLLVKQAQKLAIDELTGGGCLADLMKDIARSEWYWSHIRQPSPLSFPLIVERIRARIGSETLAERIAHMQRNWVMHSSSQKKRRQKKIEVDYGDQP